MLLNSRILLSIFTHRAQIHFGPLEPDSDFDVFFKCMFKEKVKSGDWQKVYCRIKTQATSDAVCSFVCWGNGISCF